MTYSQTRFDKIAVVFLVAICSAQVVEINGATKILHELLERKCRLCKLTLVPFVKYECKNYVEEVDQNLDLKSWHRSNYTSSKCTGVYENEGRIRRASTVVRIYNSTDYWQKIRVVAAVVCVKR